MYRLLDIVMVNFFHQTNLILDFGIKDDIHLKKEDLEENKRAFANRYIKARPAIIISIIKGKDQKIKGYVVAPLTTKNNQYLNHYRTEVNSKYLKDKSWIKWDGLTTISKIEIIDHFRNPNGVKSLTGAEKKYICLELMKKERMKFYNIQQKIK